MFREGLSELDKEQTAIQAVSVATVNSKEFSNLVTKSTEHRALKKEGPALSRHDLKVFGELPQQQRKVKQESQAGGCPSCPVVAAIPGR